MTYGRLVLMLLLTTIYAACYVAIKAGLAVAPPFRFAGLRAAIAGLVLIGVLAARGAAIVPPSRLWPGTALLAAMGTSFYFGAMFLSTDRSGAGIASVLGNLGPLFTILLAAAMLGESLTPAKIAALVLGLTGVTMIAYPTMAAPTAAGALGVALPLLAALASAGESVTVKHLSIGPDLLPVAAWQLLIGSAPLLLLSAWLEGDRPIAWSRTFVLLLLFLAVIGSALATSLWYWLVQGSEVGRLTLFLFLVPVLGLAFASVVFRERLGRLELIGVTLTVLGLAGVLREQPKPGRGHPGA